MDRESFMPIPDASEYLVGIDGFIYSTKSNKFLTPVMTGHGYLQVNINGVQRKVHEIVLTTFVGPCPEGLEARHLDGVKTHNHSSNLAWGTKSENTIDQIEHGTFCGFDYGEDHINCKLSTAEVDFIMSKKGVVTQAELAKQFTVNQSTISRIHNRRRRVNG